MLHEDSGGKRGGVGRERAACECVGVYQEKSRISWVLGLVLPLLYPGSTQDIFEFLAASKFLAPGQYLPKTLTVAACPRSLPGRLLRRSALLRPRQHDLDPALCRRGRRPAFCQMCARVHVGWGQALRAWGLQQRWAHSGTVARARTHANGLQAYNKGASFVLSMWDRTQHSRGQTYNRKGLLKGQQPGPVNAQ
jgi:hypothetical protein